MICSTRRRRGRRICWIGRAAEKSESPPVCDFRLFPRGLTTGLGPWYSCVSGRRVAACETCPMATLELTVTLPEGVAREAEANGLLTSDALERLLREEIRRRQQD